MIVWAKQNGNWTDSNIWVFWNETTQQIEDYGQPPQSNDFVYCNGYIISFATTLNIGSGTISNDTNPFTNRIGGHITATSGAVVITANLIANGEYIYQSGHLSNTINGNISGSSTNYILYRSGNALNSTWNINGNVNVLSPLAYDVNATMTWNINGNATIENASGYIKNPNTLTVNGFLKLVNSNLSVGSGATINSNLIAEYSVLICNTRITINGNIDYKSVNNSIGISTNNLIVSNNIIWKDTTEPRSNPFFIVTNAELENLVQYPIEEDVKNGVPYAYGAKVGKLIPVNASNTINVYPYKKWH